MINRDDFFFHIRAELFNGMTQPQVNGCNAILDAWEKWQPGVDLRFVAYAFATAYHETAATMQPIEEYGRGRGHAYGLPVGKYHQIYDGRGFVQLTWEPNYQNATRHLRARGVLTAGQDLDVTPKLALELPIAGAILVFGSLEGWFTGKKLADYFSATADDAVNARRIINGVDCASAIAGYHDHFLRALSF